MKGWGVKQQGFTIIELLIVVIVIAIISTIVVVSYTAVVNNGHDTAVTADLKKLADKITLEALDTGSIPDAGASLVGGVATGDSTLLSGISVALAKESYETSHSNVYYCVGDINGTEEFAVLARSTSGKSFAYRSDQGAVEITSINVGESGSPVTNCGAVGITEPLGWSYGYNATTDTWYAWANATN